MFLILMEVLFSIFAIALLIFLSNLKERHPEFSQTGWSRLNGGLVFVLLSGITGILVNLPLSKGLFGSVSVAWFLQFGFLIAGLGWIFWGISEWLSFIRRKTEQVAYKEQELEFIRSTIQHTQKGTALVELLESFLRDVTTHYATEQAALWILNPSSGELILAAYRGLSPQLAKSLEKLSVQEGVTRQVASGDLYFSSQIRRESDYFLNYLSAEGIQSIVCLPFTSRQSKIGILALLSDQKFKFAPSAASLLTEALSHLGEKVEFLRLSREIKKKTDTLQHSISENRILSVLSGYLNSDLALEPILDRVLWEGLKVINASVGHIFVLDRDRLEVKATLEPSMVRVSGTLSEFPLINRLISSRNPVMERSHLLVPILRQGKILGAMWFENKDTSASFNQHDLETAKTLANQASIALANWQLQQSNSEIQKTISQLSANLRELESRQAELLSSVSLTVPSASLVNDLNNLLAGVLGKVELLQERLESGGLPYNQSLADDLRSIEKTTLQAAQLLKQFNQSSETAEIVQEAAPEPEVVEELPAETKRGLKILAIDDQKMILDLLESMLSTLGHSIELAESGEEGLKKFNEDSFDLVITDLGMPDISGFEVSQRIKQSKPEVPVVLITGWGSSFGEEELKKNGVDYLLAKPFRLEQLTEVIEKVRLKSIMRQLNNQRTG
ncbi:MAG: hypothetical protein A2Z27_05880 [candidate division Zixibacteria bacterium RBG_16_50_21]|nr:MAG: hypothetical protein A2Z27_05880 [candidate division Zixibacteria bacterium RBG_16_50_21]